MSGCFEEYIFSRSPSVLHALLPLNVQQITGLLPSKFGLSSSRSRPYLVPQTPMIRLQTMSPSVGRKTNLQRSKRQKNGLGRTPWPEFAIQRVCFALPSCINWSRNCRIQSLGLYNLNIVNRFQVPDICTPCASYLRSFFLYHPCGFSPH